MPFSGWFKGNQFEIASASPERYLKKEGSSLVSQPIKGTIRRGANPEEDERLKHQLRNSEKERAENMMIVDLVRNDLAKVSVTGSTTVEEMFGIYPFPKVFQMISTVTSVLKPDLTMLDPILSSFPMGSMTGAPKIEVMKQIANLEPFKRGAFSGALGYFGPEETFDFNVLIRSLFINHQIKQSGFAVGSAITIDSVGQEEWEECKLKAAALLALCGSTWEE
jgi:para-aminobenzoate synthetase component 1